MFSLINAKTVMTSRFVVVPVAKIPNSKPNSYLKYLKSENLALTSRKFAGNLLLREESSSPLVLFFPPMLSRKLSLYLYQNHNLSGTVVDEK